MSDIRIIQYSSKYYWELSLYIKKIWPDRKTEYIDYCLKKTCGSEGDAQHHLLVLNEEDRIVGCHLFFFTKAMIYGKESPVYWGHDTFVDEEYRGDVGMMLMLEVQSIPHFGMGLSDVNAKIQRVLKSTFFKELVLYGTVNSFFICSFVRLVMKKKSSCFTCFVHPGQLKMGKWYFDEIKDATVLNIPNRGYWCKGHMDIDFIRDYDYLSTRFFHSFNTYYFYHLLTRESFDSCYFVVRPIIYKNMPALSIVDFRYDPEHPEQYSLILKAVDRIAKLNKIGLVLHVTNIGNQKPLIKSFCGLTVLSFFPLLLCRTQGIEYIATTSCHLPDSATSLVTGADSDYDFLRQGIG